MVRPIRTAGKSAQERIAVVLALLNDIGMEKAAVAMEIIEEVARYRRQDRPTTPSPAPGDTDTPTERDGTERPPKGE